ncbi:hypothetical protein GWN26_00570 [Candidatus Saccharibacteria bacterium]|nr:hypothetical protein [Candidatus Saccharibacteria bacterium]NIV03143.1 hypothetical protein [Calditrichia bacterium]NIS37671.1 hypothetical protein [Candidatus Saccharibacteria bacterium]NIV73123.1 hypothetical protein [Calditrichia bacterium]NIV97713.1 hypothetical protein [Candidatus Saccharibacteria bacterium]
MTSDCERFEDILRKLKTTEDLTEEEINFYIAHEDTCERPEHKAPTWETFGKDPETKPIADAIAAEILHDIESLEETDEESDEQ